MSEVQPGVLAANDAERAAGRVVNRAFGLGGSYGFYLQPGDVQRGGKRAAVRRPPQLSYTNVVETIPLRMLASRLTVQQSQLYDQVRASGSLPVLRHHRVKEKADGYVGANRHIAAP